MELRAHIVCVACRNACKMVGEVPECDKGEECPCPKD